MFLKRALTNVICVLLSLMVLIGCQSGTPVGPTEPAHAPPQAQPIQAEDQSQDTAKDGLITNLLGFVIKTILPMLGGELNIQQLQTKLVIPPGAVPGILPVLMRYSVFNEAPRNLPDALNRVYEFGPQLQFLRPCKLYVPFSTAGVGSNDPTLYRMYYYNENTMQWEPQETLVDLTNSRFVVTITHFSRYAFAR